MTKKERAEEAKQLAKVLGASVSDVMELVAEGFEQPPDDGPPRMIISTEAPEKTGKTHFAIHTTPSPVALLDFDIGTEGLIEKGSEGRVIIRKAFNRKKEAEIAGEVLKQKDYLEEWEDFRDAFRAVINNSLIRTAVVDTGTEMYELIRLALLGKLEQVMPHHYGPVNRELSEVIRWPLSTPGKNVVFTHKVKKEYKNDKWSGGYERAGFSDMAFAVQINVEHFIEEDEDPDNDEFGIRVLNCRLGTRPLRGLELKGPNCSFARLGRKVFPDSTKEDWE